MLRFTRSVALLLAAAIGLCVACGGRASESARGGDGDGDGDGDGTDSVDGAVTEQWTGYCTGTFTQDTRILDAFGGTAFNVLSGETYLFADFDDSFGGRALFLYLTESGPDRFDVFRSGGGAWPFTSNCVIGAGVRYFGVFADVSVFAEEELTTKICDLTAGSALPAGTFDRGLTPVGSDGEFTVLEVMLGPFRAQCEDAARGYFRAPKAQSFDAVDWLSPFSELIGPE